MSLLDANMASCPQIFMYLHADSLSDPIPNLDLHTDNHGSDDPRR